MPIYPVEEALLREPNLWTPGKKPVGNVKIDWSNQLTNGLSHCILYTQLNSFDLVTGSMLSTFGNTGVVYNGLIYDESGDYSTLSNVTLGSSYTILTNVKFTDNTGSKFQYFFSFNGFNAANSIHIYLVEESDITTPNTLSCVINTNSATDWQLLDANYYPNKNGKNICIAHSGTSASMYVDGINVDTSVPDASTGTTSTLYLSSRSDNDVDRYLGGVQIYTYIYGSIRLSEAEIQSINSDPYQFLIPA